MTIEQFDRKAKTIAIVAAMDRDGAALLHDQIDDSTAGNIVAELSDSFDALRQSQSQLTLSPDAIFTKSRSAVERIAHPGVLEVADSILCRYCTSYQLGSAAAIEMQAGADAQDLAVDAAIYRLRMPGVECQLSAIWALDELTADNGAPTLIPGSHRGDIMRLPDAKDRVTVPMPRGSVLLCMGWILRGWSANGTEQSSTVLVNRYSLGWLRSEVNYTLSLPAATVQNTPRQVRRLLGFESYENGRLGWYPNERPE